MQVAAVRSGRGPGMFRGVWSLRFGGKLPGVASFPKPPFFFPNSSFLGHSSSQHRDL